jgi:hypothetical protein
MRGEAAATSASIRVASPMAMVSRRQHSATLARARPRSRSRTKDARLASLRSMLRQSSCGAAGLEGSRLSAHWSASSSSSMQHWFHGVGAWKTSCSRTGRNPSWSMHARPTSDSDASVATFLRASTLELLPAPDWRQRLSAASDGSSASAAAGSGRWWSVESQSSMRWRRVRLGTSAASPSGCIVIGQVRPAGGEPPLDARPVVRLPRAQGHRVREDVQADRAPEQVRDAHLAPRAAITDQIKKRQGFISPLTQRSRRLSHSKNRSRRARKLFEIAASPHSHQESMVT